MVKKKKLEEEQKPLISLDKMLAILTMSDILEEIESKQKELKQNG